MSNITHIQVVSQTDGYRRAGMGFTRAGVHIELSTLSEEQAKALQGDPRLTITPVTPDDTGDGAGTVADASANTKTKTTKRK